MAGLLDSQPCPLILGASINRKQRMPKKRPRIGGA
jgi:hypothetical protein